MSKAGAEAFLRSREGRWLMGVPRQNGAFACIDVETGRTLWERQTGGTPSDACACDIDGDGAHEFLVGTSHGDLLAIRDEGSKCRVVWKASFPASVGTPVVADADNDGASEVVVPLGDGRLCLLK
jgi:outer membrane protein assembly factor BamB